MNRPPDAQAAGVECLVNLQNYSLRKTVMTGLVPTT